MMLNDLDEQKFQQGLSFLSACAREARFTATQPKTAKQQSVIAPIGPTILWDAGEELTREDLPIAEDVLAARGQTVDTGDPESLLSDQQKRVLTRMRVLMIPVSHVMRQKHFKEIMALKKQHGSLWPVIDGQKHRIGFKYGKVGVFPLADTKTAKRPA